MVGKPLAVSMGEPAGIGPDVILQAFDHLRSKGSDPGLCVFGDPNLFEQRARSIGVTVEIESTSLEKAAAKQSGNLSVVDTGPIAEKPGQLNPRTGQATVAALEAALNAVREGHCSALVTAPIHKANLYATGFGFPGHTEFLEDYARQHWPEGNPEAVMMLAGPELRTVPVTVHVPLQQAADHLTASRIMAVARVVSRDLKERFGIESPRLVAAGLNPHAGENGALGTEDDNVIRPALESLQQEGINIEGPLPADTMFHTEARQTYDAALCMYHDQALIPVKTLDFHHTVNVTLGLPFVRTSPDHGTALSLAGTGKASPASMIAAIELASRLARASKPQPVLASA